MVIPTLPVRLIQPDIPVRRGGGAEVVEDFQRLMRLSHCPLPGTLLVWPESAAFPFLWDRDATLRRAVGTLLDDGCAVLFNTSLSKALEDGSVGYTNTALLALPRVGEDYADDPQGPSAQVQRYDKLHLVPFGEYVPLREALPFVGQLARSVGEFEPGSEIEILEWRGVRLGISICFEVVFADEVAERVRRGATVLVTLTNDAWFGDSAAPRQHLVSARFRAAENRRPLLFSGITGISAVVDARGRLVGELPLATDGVLSLDLADGLGYSAAAADAASLAPFTRAPWLVQLLSLAVVVLVLAVRIR